MDTDAGSYIELYGAGATNGGCGRMYAACTNHGAAPAPSGVAPLAVDVIEDLAGEVRGFGVLGGVRDRRARRVGDRLVHLAHVVGHVVALRAQPLAPHREVLGQIHHRAEAREHTFVGSQSRVVGREHARIG